MHIPADVAVLRNPVAARIMLVASEGERDPEKLKAAAPGDIRLKPRLPKFMIGTVWLR
jgi:hypothetical protein